MKKVVCVFLGIMIILFVFSSKGIAAEENSVNQCFSALAATQSYIEYFFLEMGDYPDNIKFLEESLNKVLPKGYKLITIPVDPATKKEFKYEPAKDKKSYKLSVPDPSKYGMKDLSITNVDWGGFGAIAEERRYVMISRTCAENIKAIATAIEFFEKDSKGKYPANQKELVPQYLKMELKCPVTDQPYIFKIDGRNYIIACPNPEEHKLKAIYFSTKEGMVAK